MIFSIPKSFKFSPTERSVKHFIVLIILCFTFMFPVGLLSTAGAQVTRLEVGDKVRVTAPFIDPMERIKGTISEMSGSVLVLSNRDSLIYISDSLIQNLEISTGKKRVIARGSLIGAVTGAMVFGAIAAIRNDVCGPTEVNCAASRSNGSAFLSGGTTGLLSGIVAGAITGFFIKIDTWERAPARLAIGVAPTRIDINEWSMDPNISLHIPFGD